MQTSWLWVQLERLIDTEHLLISLMKNSKFTIDTGSANPWNLRWIRTYSIFWGWWAAVKPLPTTPKNYTP
jgi:hypothetical protein